MAFDSRKCHSVTQNEVPLQVDIINSAVQFSGAGNQPLARVVVGDLPACNSRVNIVDQVILPALVSND